ncbi:alpha/beta-hydrolase [Ramicandelaber brevisporus]|nr:alpha/beta-hydrolase [Ramicandelaber brevisporus]
MRPSYLALFLPVTISCNAAAATVAATAAVADMSTTTVGGLQLRHIIQRSSNTTVPQFTMFDLVRGSDDIQLGAVSMIQDSPVRRISVPIGRLSHQHSSLANSPTEAFVDQPLTIRTKHWPKVQFPTEEVTVANMRRGGLLRSHDFVVNPSVPTFWTLPPKRKQTNRARGIHGSDSSVPFVTVPDVSDRNTVISLAVMASNAYLDLNDETRRDPGVNWTVGGGFGWDANGMRGYVFADPTNTTVVVAIKGSSLSMFGGGSDSATAPLDKLNDNRLFSCCCARVDITWSTVCGCYTKSGHCNQTCLEESLDRDYQKNQSDLYYHATLDLLDILVNDYPGSNVFVTGHSLGGSVASLVGLTYGLPSVAFQSPGEVLPAQRLHLPMPPALAMHRMPIWHIAQNADPIYLGTCTSITSSCYAAGYAFETKCHLGNSCVFDAVGKLGWGVDIRTHRIYDVIDKVFATWNMTEWPSCLPERDCIDCSSWTFVD